MAFTPKTWANDAAGATPITASELTRIEQGIVGAGSVSSTSAFTNVAAPIADWHLFQGTVNVATANNHFSNVCRVPITGFLRDVMIYVQAPSGNVSATVWSVGAGATVRDRLWTSGSVLCGTQGWQIVGDPNLAVIADQLIALGMGCDNTTATFGRAASISSGAQMNYPAAYAPEGTLRLASLNTGFPDPGVTLTPNATTLALLVVARVVQSGV